MPQLRVASYNVHRCIGTDGKYRPERIRDVLHELKAQIIALQEVESPPQHGEVLELLTEQSDWSFIEGPTMLREAARYGNAVLTSIPVTRHELLDLSFKQREPRGAIELTVQHHNQRLRIIATHLGLAPAERREQIRKLLDWMGPPQQDPALLTLLMGDLNEWFLWGRPLRWLRSWFGATEAPASYPTRFPLFALDRIWANPRKYMLHTKIHRTALARQASDHYPIVTTLQWP